MAVPTPAPPPARAPSVLPALERILWAAVLAATLAALVLVVRTGLLPVQRPRTHALAFWLWFLALAQIEYGRARDGVAPDAMVLDRIVDIASHAALRESELVPPHPRSTDAERRRFCGW